MAINEEREMSSDPEKVLVIAKGATVRSELRRMLEVLGFDAGEAQDGRTALERLRTIEYQAIVLEYRRYGGYDDAVCKKLRRLYSRLPILAVTANGSLNKKLAALESGADDCMSRPLAERELNIRLRSAIRRFHASVVEARKCLVVGEISFDPVRRRVEKSGSDVALTPTEFRVLEILMRQPGIPISYSTLIAAIWGFEPKANRQHLRVVIGGLRKKLEDNASEPRYLITHACFGYGFCDLRSLLTTSPRRT
jgi:two-component system KDP operon response regulator KdpE